VPSIPNNSLDKGTDFTFLADSLPQLVWITEPNGNHIYYNQRWYTYTGLDFEQSKNEGWSLVLHPQDYQRTLQVWQHSLTTGQAYQIEYRFKRYDGVYRWFLGQALPQKDQQGKIIKWFGTCTDIDEQKLTQVALEESRQREKAALEVERSRLYELFQQAPVGIGIYTGREHIISLVNPTMEQMLGRSAQELLGKPLFEALPEVKGQGFEGILGEVFTKGTPFEAREISATLEREGKLVPGFYNTLYHPFRTAGGEVTDIIQVVVEVTAQVEARQKVEQARQALQKLNEEIAAANEELSAANEELAAANEEVQAGNEELRVANSQLTRTNDDLDTFIYAASHDLKAPILNIEGLLSILTRKLPAENTLDPTLPKVLNLIKEAINRFKVTIAELTEISKIVRVIDQEVAPVALPEVLIDVLLDLQGAITEADAQIEVAVSGCPVIAFSRKNLHSVVHNLLSNALKYRSPDRRLRVRITCQPGGEYTVFTVEDNGLGMDLSQEGKIFTMFKRLHYHVEGSGVGLYIVKKILDNAGGRIEVESQVDKGSIFRVYFRQEQQGQG